MTKRTKLNLTIGAHGTGLTAIKGSEHRTSIVKGEGAENYPFPSADEIVRRSLKRDRSAGRRGKKRTVKSNPADEKVSKLLAGLGDGDLWSRIIPAIPQRSDRDSYKPGQTLILGADGMQRHMAKRQFDGLMDDIFGRLNRAVEGARTKLPAKYQPTVESIDTQLVNLKEMYLEALPKLVAELANRNPGAPIGAVISKAVELLNEELAQILFVLRIYTDAFEQYGEGAYARKVRAMNFYFEQAFMLFCGQLPTSSFKVGDLVLSRYSNMPLGTIPGSRGPIGVHAFQLPFNMLDIMFINLPLMSHEARHNIFHDVLGLEEESMLVLKAGMEAADASGKLKLSSKNYRIGRNSVPAVQLLTKFATDCIGEIDADLGGGGLFNGPAYLRNMLLSFPAMLVRGGSVKDTTELLRTESVYNLHPQEDGSMALEFEVHPPDWIRAHIVAEGLRAIGYGDDADQFEELADFAVGTDLPDVITWRDATGKSSTVIEIPTADLKAIAPVVADSLIHKPLKALGGRSNNDCTTWNAKRQAKVELLTEALLAGETDVPTDGGDMFATYIGAAGSDAYWRLVEKGDEDSFDAALKVGDNVLTMLEKLQAKS